VERKNPRSWNFSGSGGFRTSVRERNYRMDGSRSGKGVMARMDGMRAQDRMDIRMHMLERDEKRGSSKLFIHQIRESP
jgi:hypothetical protein